MVDAQHGELEVGQRMACAQHVERAFDLLLARIDQGHESIRRESVTAHRFAERFDDGLGARLAVPAASATASRHHSRRMRASMGSR